MRVLSLTCLAISVFLLLSTSSVAGLTPSDPIVISGQNGTTIQGLKITSTTGDCVTIVNSTNITIQNSEIGPCGGGTTANGINISGGSGIAVYDSYIHPETLTGNCCDFHDGIFIHDGAKSVTIQGNVIAYGESNIEALSSTDTTKYLYPENQEDSINFGYTNGAVVQGNFITGGHSPSGCGLIADDSANSMQFKSNMLLNSGQCGIGIADGTNQIVDSNKVYNTNSISGAGNTAIYVWKQYAAACGPTTVSNNVADEIKPDGTHSGFWDGGGCSASLTNNTFGQAADSMLTPVSTIFPAPSIPPQPKNCVVTSPYTTKNGTSCDGPAPPTNLVSIVH